MKKKLLLMMMLIVSISLIGGCSLLKAVSNTGNNETKDTQESESEDESEDGGLLDGIKDAVEGKFELKQESITLEMGTELGDISEYVIADNYDDITMEVAPPDGTTEDGENGYLRYYEQNDWTYLLPNIPPYITFTRGEKVLTMNIDWVDTTPPTLESTEVTYYYFYTKTGEELRFSIPVDVTMNTLRSRITTMKLFDNSCLPEDSIEVDNIFLDGEPVENQKYSGGYVMSFDQCESGEVHVIEFTVSDKVGNTAQLTMNMTIIHDVSPEDRQKLLDHGFSDEQINEGMKKLYEQHKENPIITSGPRAD